MHWLGTMAVMDSAGMQNWFWMPGPETGASSTLTRHYHLGVTANEFDL